MKIKIKVPQVAQVVVKLVLRARAQLIKINL